jgi:hypothetical protein
MSKDMLEMKPFLPSCLYDKRKSYTIIILLTFAEKLLYPVVLNDFLERYLFAGKEFSPVVHELGSG